MKSNLVWIDKIHDVDNVEQNIYDLCFKPDGLQLLIAVGQTILVYDCSNGAILQSLNGHKDTVYCIDYCKDGKKFASGGADKVVIIWTSKLEAVLKYTHNDAIQNVRFNSVTYLLVSCAITDFSFWSSELKSVQKYKISSRINASCWNIDGQYLALGLANGTVSIRNAYGDERCVIERPGGSDSPIWALAFSTFRGEYDVLCITDWNQRLSFYDINGKKVHKERNIGFEALSITYTYNGEYILISGCNNQCLLFNREGIYLGAVCEKQKSWIWACASHPTDSFVAIGCYTGTVSYFHITFSTVHSLYREYYAYRDYMTDIIVHHLLTDDKVRIRCRNLIRKIAIYKNRLAVLLPTRVTIYELYDEQSTKLRYRIKERIKKVFDCDLLVVCSHHIILCQGINLQCYTLKGLIVRQWMMDSAVRYIKVAGGPPNNEGLIVGLADGQVLKIYIDNPFPIDIIKSTSCILCLDLSLSRKKLALVNDENRCIVYDIFSKQSIIQEMKGNSVCWNLLFDDMLCYSGNGVLNIKIDDCSPYQQKFSGCVIGAYGSKIFSLNGSSIEVVEVSCSSCMHQCLEKRLLNEAYTIACLGVTDDDWNDLARVAVQNVNLIIATKAYSKLRNLPYLDLIYEYQEEQHEKINDVFIADILAYDGKFKEASKLYQSSGHEYKALEMYTELRMFDLAQEFIKCESSTDKQSLIRKKAEWAQNINEPKAAAEMYISAGDIAKAVDIAVENNWIDMVLELGRKLDENHAEQLEKIAECLSCMGEIENAVEIYRKIGLEKNILQLHIDMKNWTDAFPIVETYPEFKQMLYIPYAAWLIENDKFVEAQKAFHKAGKPEQAIFVLKQLIENAIDETRFIDAGYYHWILSRQSLNMTQDINESTEDALNNFVYHDKCASIYYAYNAIHKYLEEPFTSYQPEALFNISRFLLNETKHSKPKGVTQFSILYSLAKQARNLGAFKLAKQSLDHIQNLLIPSQFQDFVDVATLMIRAKPYHDNEDLLIMCYRCSTYNPLTISTKLTTSANCCTNCRQPFVYSFVTFEVLPLIEFQLEDDIPDDEAMDLLQNTARAEHDDRDSRINLMRDDVQSIILLDDKPTADLFTTALMNFELDSEKFNPIIVNRETLRAMEPSTVLICKCPPPLKFKYYKNLVPELHVTACSSCFKIFHTDDFEMEILQKGCCPFCRVAPTHERDLPSSHLNDEIEIEEEFP